MAKWYGAIGYVSEQIETTPGVWTDQIIERKHKGTLTRISSRWSTPSDSINDDLTVNNQISIVADPFAYKNFQSMRYVEFAGTKWKVESVEVKYPRLILTIGGVYNGKQAGTA